MFNRIVCRMTHAPLPKYLDLFHTLISRTPSEDRLSNKWAFPADHSYWFSRSAWSMLAVALFFQRIHSNRTPVIWLPEFFCNESLFLLRNAGVRLVFYPVDSGCQPLVSMFPKLCSENKPDIFFLVHYFGRASCCMDALKFCRLNDAWLVEDAAHVLLPNPDIGSSGDFVLYSQHKHLAIPDGALLIGRSMGPANIFNDAENVKLLKLIVLEIVFGSNGFNRLTLMWLVKRVAQKLGFRSSHSKSLISKEDRIQSNFFAPPVMTNFSKKLLNFELSRLDSYASRRRVNALAWYVNIGKKISNHKIEFEDDATVPYLACIRAHNANSAKAIYDNLLRNGAPVTTWPDLPTDVIHAGHPSAALLLKNTRIYLSVHQSISQNQIASCVGDDSLHDDLSYRLRTVDSKDEWEFFLVNCANKNLPQTWEYGSAKSMAEGWAVRRAVVLNEQDVPIALLQILVKRFFGFFNVVRVNRGPIMLSEHGLHNERAIFAIQLLKREIKKLGWSVLQIAPFLPPDSDVQDKLKLMGFKKQASCPADSALVSLEGSEEQLVKGFTGKWRNCLRKGQKMDVSIHFDRGGRRHLQWLLAFYNAQQVEKRFEGTSDKMLSALVASQSPEFEFNLFIAYCDGTMTTDNLLGMLVTLRFGDVSEYLIGITNDKGRNYQANSVLLWEAIRNAKDSKCRWFDVGGLSAATTKGIAEYKKGLRPASYALVGEWRHWL